MLELFVVELRYNTERNRDDVFHQQCERTEYTGHSDAVLLPLLTPNVRDSTTERHLLTYLGLGLADL